jgi:hypothetical protein
VNFKKKISLIKETHKEKVVYIILTTPTATATMTRKRKIYKARPPAKSQHQHYVANDEQRKSRSKALTAPDSFRLQMDLVYLLLPSPPLASILSHPTTFTPPTGFPSMGVLLSSVTLFFGEGMR